MDVDIQEDIGIEKEASRRDLLVVKCKKFLQLTKKMQN